MNLKRKSMILEWHQSLRIYLKIKSKAIVGLLESRSSQSRELLWRGLQQHLLSHYVQTSILSQIVHPFRSTIEHCIDVCFRCL